MARQQAEMKTETTASDRLKELTDRLAELQEQRRRISEGMSGALDKDKVEMILQGEDLDLVMKDHEEAITSIDNKTEILRGAIRGLSAGLEQERVAKRREALERERPAYIGALKEYVQAIRALHAAEEALREHEAFKLSPIGFPGLHMRSYQERERAFADVLTVRGIDPADVGIKVPDRPKIVEQQITPAMRKALSERYRTAGKASELFDFSRTQPS